MATNTMEAIKKKMQAMRLEKESAFDRADQLENKLMEQKLIYEKVSASMYRLQNPLPFIKFFCLEIKISRRCQICCSTRITPLRFL
jgi:hypothetical protein